MSEDVVPIVIQIPWEKAKLSQKKSYVPDSLSFLLTMTHDSWVTSALEAGIG